MLGMLSGIMLAMRLVVAVFGALGLLYVLSYPDSILPPSPDIAYVSGWTVYDAKEWMWVAPLLLMELASAAGKRKNFVWFAAQDGVLIVALWAYPVLRATVPELVEPTFSFEDGKLQQGLVYYSIICVGSVLLRKVLVPALSRNSAEEQQEGAMNATVLDPAHALTVREIAAKPRQVKVRFLFGEPDESLIRSFVRIMRRIGFLRMLRHLGVALFTIATLLWVFLYPQPNEEEALTRDKAVMYESRLTPRGLEGTFRAVHAAYRVMRSISAHESLAGLSVPQAEKWLQLDRVPENYRTLLRDQSDIELASTNPIFESRTRFLTVRSGRRIAVLYVRMNKDETAINVSEVADAGWNAVADALRRKFGADLRANSSMR